MKLLLGTIGFTAIISLILGTFLALPWLMVAFGASIQSAHSWYCKTQGLEKEWYRGENREAYFARCAPLPTEPLK